LIFPAGRCRSPCGRPPIELRGQEQSAVELPGIGATVSAKLKAPNTADEKFSEVVKSAQDAAVLVLVY
jgi:hypothetical protein